MKTYTILKSQAYLGLVVEEGHSRWGKTYPGVRLGAHLFVPAPGETESREGDEILMSAFPTFEEGLHFLKTPETPEQKEGYLVLIDAAEVGGPVEGDRHIDPPQIEGKVLRGYFLRGMGERPLEAYDRSHRVLNGFMVETRLGVLRPGHRYFVWERERNSSTRKLIGVVYADRFGVVVMSPDKFEAHEAKRRERARKQKRMRDAVDRHME